MKTLKHATGRKPLLPMIALLIGVMWVTAACGTIVGKTSVENSPIRLSTPVSTVPSTPVVGHMPQIAPSRVEGTMVYDAQHGVVVLFGGSALNDTWLWDGQAWHQAHPASSPVARTGGSMTYNAATKQVVLFGGVDASGNPLGDTWTWDGVHWTQRHPASSPSPREQAGMVYDAAQQRVVLFGGLAGGAGHASLSTNDTWMWDGTNWIQLHPALSPPARTQASMAYDANHQRVVLFGGYEDALNSIANDTWTWDGRTWSKQHPAAQPSARAGASLVYDNATGQVVLFAGAAGVSVGDLSDTWLWNGVTWTQYTTPQAPKGFYTLGTYDAVRQAVVAYVVHMQDKAVSNSETWLWNGKSWALYH